MATKSKKYIEASYYDKLYSKKDYASEARSILDLYEKIKKSKPNSVLDVGCGTGTHSIFFAQKGLKTVGTDIDCSLIDIAIAKIGKEIQDRTKFYCEEIQNVKENNFDLAVSLFHVVTHINTQAELTVFFRAIYERLTEGGIFMFDCWNGLAATLDPPRQEHRTLQVGDERIEIDIKPELHLFEQKVLMKDTIAVFKNEKESTSFSFNYEQTLWTPFSLKEILSSVGFDIIIVSTWKTPQVEATPSDWKILFICQKRKN